MEGYHCGCLHIILISFHAWRALWIISLLVTGQPSVYIYFSCFVWVIVFLLSLAVLGIGQKNRVFLSTYYIDHVCMYV